MQHAVEDVLLGRCVRVTGYIADNACVIFGTRSRRNVRAAFAARYSCLNFLNSDA